MIIEKKDFQIYFQVSHFSNPQNSLGLILYLPQNIQSVRKPVLLEEFPL